MTKESKPRITGQFAKEHYPLRLVTEEQLVPYDRDRWGDVLSHKMYVLECGHRRKEAGVQYVNGKKWVSEALVVGQTEMRCRDCYESDQHD